MATAQSLPHSASSSFMTCSRGNVKTEVVPKDPFPAGLRVMVVDDDPICLLILDRMLRRCSYQVTTCGRAADALEMLRENKDDYDLVISDVYMPDMDGFKLLELVGLEMELPVIMMSSNGETSAVMKGIKHGACDYLLKPVRIEELKNIWQHVVRKKWRASQKTASFGDDKVKRGADDSDLVSSANEGLDGVLKQSKKRKDIKDEEEDADQDNDDPLKRPRVVWSVDLHQQFVAVVNQLGIDKAFPKRILELMSVQGLTRENVASHLQKYRLYLKRISGAVHEPGGLHPPFAGSPDSSFGAVSAGAFGGMGDLCTLAVSAGAFGGMGDLCTLAATGQLSPQALMLTLQAGLLGRLGPSNNPGIGGVDPSLFLQVAALQGANSSAAARPSYGKPLINNQTNLQTWPSDLKQLVQTSQPPPAPLGLVAGSLDKGPTGMWAFQQKQQLVSAAGFECMRQLVGLHSNLQVDPHNTALMMQAPPQQTDGHLAEGLILPSGGVQGQYGVLADMGPWVSPLSNMNSVSAAVGTRSEVQSSGSFRAGPVSPLGVAGSPSPNMLGSRDNKGPHLTVPNSLDVCSPLGSSGLDSVLGPSRIKSIVGAVSEGSPQTLSSFSPNFTSLSGVRHQPRLTISQRNQAGWPGFGLSQEFGQANSPVPSPRYGQTSSSSQGLNLGSGQEQGQLRSPRFTRLFPGNLGVEGGLMMASVGNTPFHSEQSTADSVLKVKEENLGVWMGSKTEQGFLAAPLSDDLLNILLKQHQEKLGLTEGQLAAGDSFALNNMYVK